MVSSRPAMLDEFCRAIRTTLVQTSLQPEHGDDLVPVWPHPATLGVTATQTAKRSPTPPHPRNRMTRDRPREEGDAEEALDEKRRPRAAP